MRKTEEPVAKGSKGCGQGVVSAPGEKDHVAKPVAVTLMDPAFSGVHDPQRCRIRLWEIPAIPKRLFLTAHIVSQRTTGRGLWSGAVKMSVKIDDA